MSRAQRPAAPRPVLLAAVALALAVTLGAAPAAACHLPEHLRLMEPNLTPAQLALMAHHGSQFEQIPYSLEEAVSCTAGVADIFPCDNVDLLAVLQLNQIGGGSGNDVWGWKDPVTSKEYALMGRSNGTAFVDLSDPENPVYVGNLPTHASSSTWRDIKTFADHAFIVADFAGNHGMQVFDLTRLRGVVSPPVTFTEDAHYSGFTRSHNLAINEATGFAYAVGSDTCSGGLHMIDINNPTSPVSAGCFSGDGYTHDVQCVVYSGPDPKHAGHEICFASNEDTLTIVDVTDKGSPQLLARQGYSGSGYTHQGWLTEDQGFFIHDDELDELFFGHATKTYVWNVANLEAPVLAGTFLADGFSIDHNQYIRGNRTYQANYRRGLRILSIDDAATGALSEVGFFDSYPESDGESFEGAWSSYPFFDSGIVLISDINRGLFIVRPQLDQLSVAGSCPGTVTFEVSGMTPNASVSVLRGTAEGETPLPGGPCAGTLVDLANPRRLATLTTDANGNAQLERSVPAGACGLPVQAVDITTCGVTNLSAIPE